MDLGEWKVKEWLVYPLTNMGKVFHRLLNQTWQAGCILEQWQEVHIVNLFKGGDSEAYNRVYHAYLFCLLNHVGVCRRFLRVVVELCTKTRYAVQVGEYLSASFTPM